jgi:ADP-ribose pyrophosphatase YjhB (NUDIX family)
VGAVHAGDEPEPVGVDAGLVLVRDLSVSAPLRFREAVRALVVSPDDEVLLARFVFPNGVEVWALPGGGLEEGETPEEGLRRELREELGLTDVEIGPHVWNREHIVPMRTGHDGQRDRVHLVRIERFEPVPAIGWPAMREEYVFDLRWWTISEIEARPDLRFVPRRLVAHLTRLLAEGSPTTPVDVGV